MQTNLITLENQVISIGDTITYKTVSGSPCKTIVVTNDNIKFLKCVQILYK